jgi:hypothetical protein
LSAAFRETGVSLRNICEPIRLGIGIGRRKTLWAMLKTTVLEAIPMARVTTTETLNLGDARKERTA